MLSNTYRAIVNRHRVGIGEAVLIICVVFIAGFVVFEYEFGDSISGEKQVDFQEMIGLGILFVGCTICFGWRRIVEQEREIVRRITAESRAHELANTDALTGLANRRQFERVLKETVASPPGAGRVHAVLALDLNKFKRINDVYGHLMGDDVLVVVAQRLSAAMRDGDLLARLGAMSSLSSRVISQERRAPPASPAGFLRLSKVRSRWDRIVTALE
jgi:predicted signal transduction protein with EAL and GGDEF domain